MDALMTIGDFSRAVRLSAKALRFYHRIGLLPPRSVDAQNGYRLYAPSRSPTRRSSGPCGGSTCPCTRSARS